VFLTLSLAARAQIEHPNSIINEILNDLVSISTQQRTASSSFRSDSPSHDNGETFYEWWENLWNWSGTDYPTPAPTTTPSPTPEPTGLFENPVSNLTAYVQWFAYDSFDCSGTPTGAAVQLHKCIEHYDPNTTSATAVVCFCIICIALNSCSSVRSVGHC